MYRVVPSCSGYRCVNLYCDPNSGTTDYAIELPLTRNWVLFGRASAAGGGLCRRLGGRGGARAGGLGLGLGRQAASAGVTVMTQPGLSFCSWRIR